MKKKDGKYIYDYLAREDGKLKAVKLFEKKFLFSKYLGEYRFDYNEAGQLIQQTSVTVGFGITEIVKYSYDEAGRLFQKNYYNEKAQLRYTVSFFYSGDRDKAERVEVTRMGTIKFFETKQQSLIKKMIEVVGNDFEGSFHLLEIVEQAGKNNA